MLNSNGEPITDNPKISDIQILKLVGGGDKSFHALPGDIVTPSQGEMLQLGAVVRQHSKGDIIDVGTFKVCMCQLGTRCDEFLDATAAEQITPSNINMSELGTVFCYEVDALAS